MARLGSFVTAGGLGWALLVALSGPVPVALPGWRAVGSVEDAWQVLWVLVAGGTALVGVIAGASRALAALAAWMLVRTALLLIPVRALEVVLVTLCLMLVYAVAVRAVPAHEPWMAGGILALVGVNALLGVLNLLGLPSLVGQDPYGLGQLVPYAGRPVGFVTNPNHWALLLALGLPLLWWRRPRYCVPALLAWLAFLALSGSAAAVGAALGAMLLILLAEWGWRRARWLAAAMGLGAVAVLMLRGGPELLGGRAAMWRLSFEAILSWPLWTGPGAWKGLGGGPSVVMGAGPGMWRQWAAWEHGPVMARREQFLGYGPAAHSEPLQVFFELGLLGVVLSAWLVWSVLQDAELVWATGDRLGQAWVLVVLVGAIAMWATIPFRLPVLAFPIIVAAARVRARARAILDGTHLDLFRQADGTLPSMAAGARARS